MGFRISKTIGGIVLSGALLALTGCNMDYTTTATAAQLASLFKPTATPTSGGFFPPPVVPTATYTPTSTLTPTATATSTPTATNTSVPVAASLSIEVAPSVAGSAPLVPTGTQFDLAMARCYKVSAVARTSNGTEIAVTATTGISVIFTPGFTGAYSNAACTTTLGALSILNGQSRTNFYVLGTSLTTYTLQVSRLTGMMLTSATAMLRFVRDYAKLAFVPEVANATTLPGGLCYALSVVSRGSDNQTFVQPQNVNVSIRAAVNINAYSQAGCPTSSQLTPTQEAGQPNFVRTIAAGQAVTTLWLKSTVATGTVNFVATPSPLITGFYAVEAGQLNLTLVRVITKLHWRLDTQPVIAGVCSGEAAQASTALHTMQAAELEAYSVDNVLMQPTTPITATVTAPAGTSVYGNASCGATTSSAVISNGFTGKVWVRAAAPGTTIVTAAATGLDSDTFNVVATNGPSASRFKTPFPSVAVTECSDPLEIEVVNSAGQAIAAGAAGGGDASLVIANFPTGSKIFAENDVACLKGELAAVAVPSALTSGRFRVRAALTNPPTYNVNLAVTQGPLKTQTLATLSMTRKDLEADRACLDQAGTRAGRNSFTMLTNYDEVAYSILRFPSGKMLLAGESIAPPISESMPGTPFGALALVGEDCRLVTEPSFFATTSGYHVLKSSVLYPGISETGSGYRKILAVNEAASAITGATAFYAVGFAVKNDGTRDVLVSRYRNNGTLDPAFGESTGIVPAGSSEPIRRGYFTVDLGLNDEAMDIAVVNNRLLVVANSSAGAVARVWLLLFDLSGNESGSRAAIQFEGTKVTFGGLAIQNDGTNTFALVGGTAAAVTAQGEQLYADWFVSKNRLTPEGFAGQPSSPAINFGSQTVGDDDRLAGIVLQTVTLQSGAARTALVMAGSSVQGVDPALQRDSAFARLRIPGLELDINQGSQDPNEFFQSNGKLLLEAQRHQTIEALALDALSHLFSVGRDAGDAGNSRPYVVRLQANGDVTPVSTKTTNVFDFGGTRDSFNAVVRRPDNKMAVAGAVGTPLHRQFLISLILE